MPKHLALIFFAGLAACSSGGSVTAAAEQERPFMVEDLGQFDEPWAGAFMPGTNLLFVTEKRGRVKFVDVSTGKMGSIQSGLPDVAYGGQGGLGDIAFSPGFRVENPGRLYLTWAEGGAGGERGVALGRGLLICQEADSCELRDLQLLFRQEKTSGGNHYGHRMAFSPDGQFLFLSLGDRAKGEPAQDFSSNLGKIFRMTLDGQFVEDNPFHDPTADTMTDARIWTVGHRNPLGLAFAPDGRLWSFEMGPRGGDEFNLIQPGKNYGWPDVSEGRHYGGAPIPPHATRPEYQPPVISWTPVIAAGDLEIYKGDLFPDWKGDALLPGLASEALIHVELDGEAAREANRWDFGQRLRAVIEGPDGAVYILTDGNDGRLLRLTPKRD